MSEVAKAPIVPVLKRRVRALAQLAAVTAVAVLLAAVALWQRASTGEPEFKPVRMFPALQAAIEDVAVIQIETKAAAFNVVRDAKGRWTLPDKSNYPADFNAVRKTVLGLAELELVEPKTSREDWQEKLGLSLPKSGGTGTLVTLKDAKGEQLASLIVGASVEGASSGGRQAFYVRRQTEPQTYVARGNFAPPTAEAQWLDKAFVDLARERVKTAALKPFKGRPYSVARAKPEDQNFKIVEAIPPGRTLRSEGEPNGIGNALLGISFDDVKPASGMDFANAAQATFVTFDGLTLDLRLIEKDQDFWMTVDVAAAAPAEQPTSSKPGDLKPDVAKEAAEIKTLVAGWAYKVPRYKGALLVAPLEDLLNPVGEGAPQKRPRNR